MTPNSSRGRPREAPGSAARVRVARAAVCALALAAGLPPAARAAESGFAFLRIPVSARSAALGGAGASFLEGAGAFHLNPAGLADAAGRARSNSPWGVVGEARLTHHEALSDLRQDAVVARFARGDESFGLAFNTLYSEAIEERDEVGRLTGSFGLTDFAAEFGYGRTVTPEVRVGGTIGYVRERIANETADTWDASLGALWRPETLPGLSLGAAVRHLGPDTQFDVDGTPGVDVALPLTVQGGASYGRRISEDVRWLVTGEVRKARDEDVTAHTGAELGWSALALRAGASLAAERSDFSAGLGVGAGRFHFDYAFVTFDDGLGETHRAELTVLFGL